MVPKVSICIPVYKQIEFLKKTLDSILNQNYQDYEIIITDDTPDDSVGNFISTYDFGGKLKYFKNPTSLGSPENWNEAIRRATGDYIKILHHDDWFASPDSLAKFVNGLDQNPQAEFAFSSSYWVDSRLKDIILKQPTSRQLSLLRKSPKKLFPLNFISTPSTTIFRRSLNLYFDRQFKWVVDVEFYIRALFKNKNYVYILDPLVYITTESEHQVTNECLGHKEIEVKEWVNFYQIVRLSSNFDVLNAKHLASVFFNFDIMTIDDLKKTGINNNTNEIKFILLLVYIKKYTSYIFGFIKKVKAKAKFLVKFFGTLFLKKQTK